MVNHEMKGPEALGSQVEGHSLSIHVCCYVQGIYFYYVSIFLLCEYM